jgi:hypothetical protein
MDPKKSPRRMYVANLCNIWSAKSTPLYFNGIRHKNLEIRKNVVTQNSTDCNKQINLNVCQSKAQLVVTIVDLNHTQVPQRPSEDTSHCTMGSGGSVLAANTGDLCCPDPFVAMEASPP